MRLRGRFLKTSDAGARVLPGSPGINVRARMARVLIEPLLFTRGKAHGLAEAEASSPITMTKCRGRLLRYRTGNGCPGAG